MVINGNRSVVKIDSIRNVGSKNVERVTVRRCFFEINAPPTDDLGARARERPRVFARKFLRPVRLPIAIDHHPVSNRPVYRDSGVHGRFVLRRGRMIPSELERLILERKSRGHIPFFVSATAGTTVLGAFDPINAIADICEKYKLWLHIDAAWGGGLLLSRKYRHPRLDGIERSVSRSLPI